MKYPTEYPQIKPTTYPSWTKRVFTPSAYARIYNDTIISPTWRNGGFETAGGGGADVFASWVEAVAGSSVIIDETDPAHVYAGSHACRYDIDATNGLANIYMGVITVGKTYKISIWAKASATPASVILYNLETGAFALTTEYQYYEFTIKATGAVIQIARAIAPSKSIWIDDITLEEVNAWHGNVMSLDMTTGGDTELDGSGLGNKGAVTGAVVASAPIGTCRQFDGVDDVITITGDKVGVGDATIEAWIYPTGWGENSYGRIIDNSKFFIAIQNSSIWCTSNASTTVDGVTGTLALNRWHHILVTRDYTGNVNFYINGVLSTANQASGIPVAGGGNTLIGNNAAGDRTFAGKIGATRLYNRILTAQEDKDNYNLDCARYGLPTR